MKVYLCYRNCRKEFRLQFSKIFKRCLFILSRAKPNQCYVNTYRKTEDGRKKYIYIFFNKLSKINRNLIIQRYDAIRGHSITGS